MATKVILKKSAVTGRVPDSSDLQYGELALNYADGILYYKDTANVVQSISGSGGGAGGVDSAATISLIESTIDSIGAIDGVETVGSNLPSNGEFLRWDSDNNYWKPDKVTHYQGAFNSHSSQAYSGDSSTVAFTLPASVTNGDDEVLVTINGIVQHTDTYSVSGTTLTFDSAPVTGDVIEARVNNILAVDVSLRDYQSYVYTPSTATTAFSGTDDNGNTLTYELGKVEAYLNGTKLISGTDYTETSGSTLTLSTSIDSPDTLEIVSLATASFPIYGITTQDSSFETAASGQEIYSFLTTAYRTIKFIAQVEYTNDNKYHSEEILLTHNDSDVFMTTYAQVLTDSSLGTFDASISSGTCSVTFDPSYAHTRVSLSMIQMQPATPASSTEAVELVDSDGNVIITEDGYQVILE